MKDKIHHNSLIVIVMIAVIGVIIFSIYMMPGDAFSRSKIYYEPSAKFSMIIPSSFNLQREIVADDEVVIKIVSPNDVVSANPGLINIVVFKRADVDLPTQSAAFLDITKDKLIPYSFTTPAYSYLSQNGQELSYYYFFEHNGYLVVFKFNKSYFDKSNPIILIDNSLYSNTVLRSLNSISFKDAV